ncbi:hypothetical protein F7018_10390 [Tenacibaculum aiptasiae]|uniref:Uncharacterized protein n=1 Tax=Tenacibaculum aiptasiae TaxID=426481 RepID=A0A7J5AK05_9FLAO|nr:hypothetical protein [Tenacibaculum aiptasiae]KAB1157329.1 hypothetical protein F7018_10390 [Tenacibaculum aiptasiae]
MKSLNTIECKIDYLIAIISCTLLFIVIKKLIPICLYGLFTLITAFYFFPMRLLINQKKNFISGERFFLIASGVIFSSILVLSILYLYVNDNSFFRNAIIVFSFTNITLMMYFYLKFNKLLLLNFIFTFTSSILLF